MLGCPGTFNVKTPTLKIKRCPECGSDVELFSIDVRIKCEKCGFPVYNDVQNCIQWCKYAKDCVGEELYRKLKKRYVMFVDGENSSGSQMAEALAKELNTNSNIEFESGGTHPAESVDERTLEVLRENGIVWDGIPKKALAVPDSDVIVTFGYLEQCQFPDDERDDSLDLIRKQLGMDNGAGDRRPNEETRFITWSVEDPKGGSMEEYRRTLEIIRAKVLELLEELR